MTTSPRRTVSCSVSSTSRRNGACTSAEVDGQLERVVVALEVGRRARRGSTASSRSEATMRGPSAAATPASSAVLGLLLEADADDAVRALDDQQAADRGAEAGEDRRRRGLRGRRRRRRPRAGCRGGGSCGVPLSERADGGGHALARGLRGDAEPAGDVVVVEVLDEAQPQGLARRLGSGAISASKAPSHRRRR